MLAESLRRVDICPQSNFLNVNDALTFVTKGLNNGYNKEDTIHIYNKSKYQQNIPNNNTNQEEK
jgi:hypothetical protein